MEQNVWLIVPVLLPVLGGLLSFLMGRRKVDQKKLHIYIIFVAVAECLTMIPCFLTESGLQLWKLTDSLPIYLHMDLTGKVFAGLILTVFTLVCLYALDYLSGDPREMSFFGWYLLVEGILMGLCLAGNLVTYYLFFELMTLTSMPLILHDLTHQAIMAALKYLFYSVAGGFAVLFGIFILSQYGGLGSFQAGGILDPAAMQGQEKVYLVAIFLIILGFGTKAGMFPMHSWLPAAHPVAPAPASAVLSGIITKMGVLGIIRSVYYVADPASLRGSWVQYVWILLTLITVFLGSMMAYREPVIKRRLAYSTVSQVSYILFGLALFNRMAFVGAILHVVFHSLVKDTLFLNAGAIIHETGKTRIDQLRGIGKIMPVTIWCFTLVSITLIGIPPTSGFLSKWNLCIGALNTDVGIFSWAGPAVLLVSALLTAGYLLPVTANGFFPGVFYNYSKSEKKEPSWLMLVPMVLMTALAVILGMFPGIILEPARILSEMLL